MRVCFISSYPPNHARLSEYAKNLVGEIANRPAVSKVYVLADTINEKKQKFQESSKVEVLRVWHADSPLSILGLFRYILKIRPDIVHYNVHFQSYGRSRLSNFIGFTLIPLTKIFHFKVLAQLHNVGEKVDLEKVRLKPTLINKLGILIATKLILSASSIVVTVRSYEEYLKKRYRNKRIHYIPHGTSANHRLLINHKEKTVLMFGHMGPSKGLPVLFRAFEDITKECDNIKMVVAGDSHPNFPGYLEDFIKAAPPGVDFLRYIEEDDIGALFSSADVIVLPYLTATGTSGVFHLACGYGKPVVASALPEIKELVKEGASALLVPPGQIGPLKDAILKLLFNEKLNTEMGNQNLNFAKKEQWSVIAQMYEKAYLELFKFKSGAGK